MQSMAKGQHQLNSTEVNDPMMTIRSDLQNTSAGEYRNYGTSGKVDVIAGVLSESFWPGNDMQRPHAASIENG
jgi:hypothetical protein